MILLAGVETCFISTTARAEAELVAKDSIPFLDFALQSGYTLNEGPDGSVLLVADGDAKNPGQIVRYDPVNGTFNTLISFTGNAGERPGRELVSLSDKQLVYGVTSTGGASGMGIIYSLNVSTGKQTILFDFSNHHTARNPAYGLRKVDDHTLIGVVEVNELHQLFTFDINSGIPMIHYISRENITGIDGLPVMLSTNTCAFIKYQGAQPAWAQSVTLAEYNLQTDKVTNTTKIPFHMGVASGLLFGKDSCLYLANHFSDQYQENYEENDFLFVKYDPRTRIVTHHATSPKDLTVFGPPTATDRQGNLIGAFLYGGPDNAGYVFRYDTQSDKIITVKMWAAGSPGVMTSSSALLDHSNGLYYGFSSSGGKNGHGCFFSLDSFNQTAHELAQFRERE